MSIRVVSIAKKFGDFAALEDVSFEIENGELIALLGPSGCGKTTLLRLIAGLEVPDSGAILFHGEDATETDVRERQVGFVFQHYALFRLMTVFENVAFGMRVRPRAQRPSEQEIRTRVHDLLKLVQLDWLADRYPSQLSGGQRQRIALARALAVEPKVLLLDEPFGALDAKVRKDLRRWLRRLHDELHVTSVFVTHDQEEALEVADRVMVLNDGRVEQIGTPQEVYEHPASPFVYQFLGDVNLFHGRVHGGRAYIDQVQVALEDHHDLEDARALLYARPHEIEIEFQPNGDGPGIEAIVRRVQSLGAVVRVELDGRDGALIEAEMSRERHLAQPVKPGEWVHVRPKNPRVFLKGKGEP
jgi:sulfate/thiosulfate transport system ATP-binding protein